MSHINLLPPQIKENIDYSKKNNSLISTLAISFVFLGVIVVLGGLGLILTNASLKTARSETKQKEIEANSYRKITIGERKDIDVEKESEKLERKISAIKSIEKDQLFWSKVIEEVAILTPDSIYLKNLPLNFAGGAKNRLSISGFAVEQLDVAVFRDALESSRFFKNVDIQSITSARDGQINHNGYNFTVTMSIVNTCLFSGAQLDDSSKSACNSTVGGG